MSPTATVGRGPGDSHSLLACGAGRAELLAVLLWPRLPPPGMSNGRKVREAQAFGRKTVGRLRGWYRQGSSTSAGSRIPPFHHGARGSREIGRHAGPHGLPADVWCGIN